jgi:hypothetical protein
VIQALATDGADHPLHERVLPGRSGGGRHLPDPHLDDAPGEDLAVDRVSIPEKVLRRGLLGEDLDELPRGPAGRGMIRDVPSIIFDVADDLEYKLNFSQAKLVITDGESYPIFEGIRTRCPSVKDIVIYRRTASRNASLAGSPRRLVLRARTRGD